MTHYIRTLIILLPIHGLSFINCLCTYITIKWLSVMSIYWLISPHKEDSQDKVIWVQGDMTFLSASSVINVSRQNLTCLWQDIMEGYVTCS